MNKEAKENRSTEELSQQEKIWKGLCVFLYSIRPLLLYLVVPALATMFGMIFTGGRTAGQILSQSGNFYYTVGILLTFYLLQKQSKKRGSSLFQDVTLECRELRKKRLFYLAGIGLGFGFFFSALITVVPFPDFLMESYISSSEAVKDGTDPFLALLSTVLLAPVVEEMIFRGYMLNRLLSWFREKEAVLFVSIAFALCHVSILWMLYAFFMGVMLARVSIKEDNIAYSMALHIGFNLNVVPIWAINHTMKLKQVLFSSPLWIACYGVIACCIAVRLLKKYRKEIMLW